MYKNSFIFALSYISNNEAYYTLYSKIYKLPVYLEPMMY